MGITPDHRGNMKKIAVFGKPGSGKSKLSKALAEATGIPLYFLDSILYQQNGEQIPQEVFNKHHHRIISSENWILDGLGRADLFYKQLHAATELIYINLPYRVNYWFVTKRMIKGMVATPEGWPQGCSVVKGSLNSYKTLWHCPKFWNQDFMRRLESLSTERNLHVIQSQSELNQFARRFAESSSLTKTRENT